MSGLMPKLKAPFPWFGGKSRVADVVWDRFGNPPSYIEPFFGSGAVLLGRPGVGHREIVNDLDGHLCNFWRAVKHDPGAVANHFDGFYCENDFHARNWALLESRSDITRRLEADPEYFDARLAGWWVYVASARLCTDASDPGPWKVRDGELLRLPDSPGSGIRRSIPLAHPNGLFCYDDPHEALSRLQSRLKNVLVYCGDWARVLSETFLREGLPAAIFLDPPYIGKASPKAIYWNYEDHAHVAAHKWALENGDDKRLKIALCGYDGTIEMPDSWECFDWRGTGGYASKDSDAARNARKERIWFSPHCIKQKTLF